MMKFLMSLLLLLLCLDLQAEPLSQPHLRLDKGENWNPSLSLVLKSQVFETSSGAVRKLFYFQCDQGSLFCNQLCSDRQRCSLNFETCEGCASAENLKLFTVFQNIHQFYLPVPQSLREESLLRLIRDERLTAIDSLSILNLMLDPTDSAVNQKTKDEFLNLCPMGAENAFVLVNLGWTPRAVICVSDSKSLVFRLKPNPEFSRAE